MTFGAFVKHFEICGQKGCVRVVITSEKEKTVKLKFEVILIRPFLFLLGFLFSCWEETELQTSELRSGQQSWPLSQEINLPVA